MIDTREAGGGSYPVPDEEEKIEEEVTFVVEYKTKIVFSKEYTREEKMKLLEDNFRDYLDRGELVEIDF